MLKSFHRGSVRLPVTEKPANRAGTILLVEDDEQVRRLVRGLLVQDGYQVIEAQTGLEALELAQRHSGQIDLLLTDMLLPELSGYDLAVRLREKLPELRILFTTGYVEGEIVQRCVAELDATFLDKPFQPPVLRAKVRETLQGNSSATGPGR